MRIGSVFHEFERIPHDGSSREVHKVFTEEEDADETPETVSNDVPKKEDVDDVYFA